VWKSKHFHQHGEISRVAKEFTNDANPTNDPGHAEHLRQLFPYPSADYDSPPQMGDDLTQHWTSEIEIDESWDTPEAFERIAKFHSIPAPTKYIRSCSFLCVPDIDGWRIYFNVFSCPLTQITKTSRYLFSIVCIYHG
jgi:hypothetical protein